MAEHKSDGSIGFTIDGDGYAVEDKHQIARALLSMAGFDPQLYDLARVRPVPDEGRLLRDEQPVLVKEGDAFVAVRTSAQVA